MRSVGTLLLLGLLITSGCARDSAPGVKVARPMDTAKKGQAAEAPRAGEHDGPGGQVAHLDEQQPPKGGGAEKEPKADQPRKIKYTADMRVIVEDFDKSWETHHRT